MCLSWLVPVCLCVCVACVCVCVCVGQLPVFDLVFFFVATRVCGKCCFFTFERDFDYIFTTLYSLLVLL